MKRGGPLPRRTPLRSKARIRVAGHSDTAEIKERIQALLRRSAIQRDGGCVLRHYPETGACGGYTNAGELILQAEHLVTRSNSVSFADMRNIVCLCRHHHGHYKPEHSLEYWTIIQRHIGPQRWEWVQRVLNDRSPHRFFLSDWKMLEVALEREIKALQSTSLLSPI